MSDEILQVTSGATQGTERKYQRNSEQCSYSPQKPLQQSDSKAKCEAVFQTKKKKVHIFMDIQSYFR